ncbi:MAG: hypothetical protein QOJ64_2807 [Acidobacteriota bacterium]|jgi:uncharacterized membrane protein YheB (UPF0754 family)|nr:hypothetical protein [Acidobacteriota bacterium]
MFSRTREGVLAIDPQTKKLIIAIAWIVIATAHGFGAAWLAIRMLFRPRSTIKLWGITIWPQGMIPRHRERLAQTIGNAVGNELVSQETVVNALFETDFFRRKVEGFVESYTTELLSTSYPSLIEALPPGVRAPVLDAISSLQLRVSEYITNVLKSEETAESLSKFIDHRVNDLLANRLGETITDETFEEILGFVESRFRRLVSEPDFEAKVRYFIGERLDDLAKSQATLAEMFTPDTLNVIKQRIDEQVPPVVHHLAEIATSQTTRAHIGALIKREVDDYYGQLSFFKKIFVSRVRIHHEVDEMVNETLPRRIEEYLRGEAFEQEAERFLNTTIDDVLSRPINQIVGQIAEDKLEFIKEQLSERVLSLARSDELSATVSAYLTDAMQRLRPHTLRALMQHLNPDSAQRLKNFLSKGLLTVFAREETARTINNILSAQVERLLVAPIGRLSDHVPEKSMQRAAAALTERITNAARERLPAALAEFDIGGIVRQKVAGYPVEKLEELVLSVAQQHLKTIELFGAVIGFAIGIAQAFYFWYFSGN